MTNWSGLKLWLHFMFLSFIFSKHIFKTVEPLKSQRDIHLRGQCDYIRICKMTLCKHFYVLSRSVSMDRNLLIQHMDLVTVNHLPPQYNIHLSVNSSFSRDKKSAANTLSSDYY